ncbi:hypothetical protein pb186bvf_020968 [Paramecium bursaria]
MFCGNFQQILSHTLSLFTFFSLSCLCVCYKLTLFQVLYIQQLLFFSLEFTLFNLKGNVIFIDLLVFRTCNLQEFI